MVVVDKVQARRHLTLPSGLSRLNESPVRQTLFYSKSLSPILYFNGIPNCRVSGKIRKDESMALKPTLSRNMRIAFSMAAPSPFPVFNR